MGQRVDFQTLLEELLGTDNVYFQPPPTFIMSYPCLVYSLSKIDSSYGDNKPYSLRTKYTVISINQDPDSEIPEKLASLEKSSFSSHYVANNLNHNVFEIFF